MRGSTVTAVSANPLPENADHSWKRRCLAQQSHPRSLNNDISLADRSTLFGADPAVTGLASLVGV